jgi:hypothetical protein
MLNLQAVLYDTALSADILQLSRALEAWLLEMSCSEP